MVTRCEFLKKCTFLDPLTNEQISKLAGALETTQYNDGEYIIRQGDMGDSFFIIEEGSVKCTQVKSSGREVDLMCVPFSHFHSLFTSLLPLSFDVIHIIILFRFCWSIVPSKWAITLERWP